MTLLLTGCGQSQDEKEKIASVSCAIMSESRNMDASIRVEKINDGNVVGLIFVYVEICRVIGAGMVALNLY